MNQKTAVALALGFLVYTTPVHALQCHEIIPDDALETASRVVIVQLISVRPVVDSETKFELSFDVLDLLKGASPENIVLTLEETAWVNLGHFVKGVRYLWFLDADQAEIETCEKILVVEGRTAQWYASWQEKSAK